MTVAWTTPPDFDGLTDLFTDADDFNTYLRDNLEYLFSRPFNSVNNTTRTTTSATFVEMTGSSISVTGFGGKMMVIVNGKISNSTAGTNNYLDIAIDGTRVGDATNGLTIVTAPNVSYPDCVSIVWFTNTPPAAGAHSYSVYWKTSGGTLSGLVRVYAMEIC